MCGIAGFWYPKGVSDTHSKLRKMGNAIARRGPDGWGCWADEDCGVGFVHRRLAVIDLSKQGHQPMISASERYVITYNGEIYNHLELRDDLKGNWRGHSDTEIILEAIQQWGIEKSLKKFVGMFAFSLWDKQTRTLTLARDRLGEKPLYYGWQNGVLLFGSELAALKANDKFSGGIDRNAMSLYLRHNMVPAPYSIYQDIYKLMPGTFWQLGQNDILGDRSAGFSQSYWSARDAAETGTREQFTGSDREATEILRKLLQNSVKHQMISDVPLGAFLSGGIDSSAITAVMQDQATVPVKTFTIGFGDEEFNEAQHAKGVARHLGTDHTELYVDDEQTRAVIPLLADLYSEPFADASQVPTYLLSKLARQHVTVCLSGDAGDELFGGYNRYYWTQNIWRKISWVPQPLRAALAGIITSTHPRTWGRIFHGLNKFLPSSMHHNNIGDKLYKLAHALPAKSADEIYVALISQWQSPMAISIDSTEPSTLITDPKQWPKVRDLVHQMMYLDTICYLPDDILTKVDRASMSVSLESRIPFLDHRILEFAWTLPTSMKIRNGQTKWILRQLLYDYVPKKLIERPKMGFGVPLETWLRGPLKDWAADLLDVNQLENDGYLNAQPIHNKWQEHLSGRRNNSYELWNILMFQAWKQSNVS